MTQPRKKTAPHKGWKKSARKTIEGAKQAVAFARGDCEHDWIYKKSKVKKSVWIRHCRRCGVRVTDFAQKPATPA